MKGKSSPKSFFLLLVISFIVMFFSAFFLTRYSAIDKASKNNPTSSPPQKAVDTLPAVQSTPTVIPSTTPPAPSPTPDVVTTLVPPADGTITKTHSTEKLSYSKTTGDWSVHCGIDISGSDKEVKASARGTVIEINENGIMGTCVTIDHPGGLQTRYYGIKDIKVSINQAVVTGDVLGTMGNAAPAEAAEGTHLHFEVWKNGTPLNPEDFFK